MSSPFTELTAFSGEFQVGFESSRIARRRLAALAGTDRRVYEALAPSLFPGLSESVGVSPELSGSLESSGCSADSLHVHLDQLAREIVATPGAGGALLAAFAEQTRALLLVVEASRRSGNAPLPESVLAVAQKALDNQGVLPDLVSA